MKKKSANRAYNILLINFCYLIQRMKKKLQIGLISGPLGDVRHTAHVGHSDGDVFGDTTFLQVTICFVLLYII